MLSGVNFRCGLSYKNEKTFRFPKTSGIFYRPTLLKIKFHINRNGNLILKEAYANKKDEDFLHPFYLSGQ